MAKDDLLKVRLMQNVKAAFAQHAASFGVTPSERIRQLILADLEKTSPVGRYPIHEDTDQAAVADAPRAKQRRKSAAA